MTSLADLTGALAEVLGTVQGLRVFDHVPTDTQYPAAFVVPPDINYAAAFKLGVVHLELDVVVLVGAVAERQQKDLFRFLDWTGPSSLALTVYGNRTLGLPNVACYVAGARPLAEDELAGYRAYGAAVRLIIDVTNPAA